MILRPLNRHIARAEKHCKGNCPIFGIGARTWMLILGVIAGALTTSSLLPQVAKSYEDWQNNVSLENLSLERYIIHLVGMIFWLMYGMMVLFTYGWKPAFPLLFFNIITTTCVTIMIFMIVNP